MKRILIRLARQLTTLELSHDCLIHIVRVCTFSRNLSGNQLTSIPSGSFDAAEGLRAL